MIANRLKEPSTWAGLALIVSQGMQAYATKDPVAIGSVFAGIAAVLMPERK